MAVPLPSKEPGRPGSCLFGLGLDAVIDGTQTGSRVDFNISEPTAAGGEATHLLKGTADIGWN